MIRNNATRHYIIVLISAVLITITLTFLTFTATKYAILSDKCQQAEQNGYALNWTESLVEKYDNAIEEKNQWIATNIVAQFFQFLGKYTVTAILRPFIFLAIIFGTIFWWYLFIPTAILCIRKILIIYKHIEKVKRRR